MRIYSILIIVFIFSLSGCQLIMRQVAGIKNLKEVEAETVFAYAEKNGIPKEDMIFSNISIIELKDTTASPKLRPSKFFLYMIYDSVGNCLYDPWSQNCGVAFFTDEFEERENKLEIDTRYANLEDLFSKLKTASGETPDFASLKNENFKYILIADWATWIKPRRWRKRQEELTNVVNLKGKERMKILYFNTDAIDGSRFWDVSDSVSQRIIREQYSQK
ncbi:MAG: hypothetical protein JJT94_03750 [Bernardetiaceae bacterium]|nr:hypothetical protein [Bernardetiaceae bacterium]